MDPLLETIPLAGSLPYLLPDVVLAVGLLLLILLETGGSTSRPFLSRIRLAIPFLAFAASWAVPFEIALPCGGLFQSDPATLLAIRLILPFALGALLSLPESDDPAPARMILVLALGATIAARSVDFLVAWLALVLIVVAAPPPPTGSRSAGSLVLAGGVVLFLAAGETSFPILAVALGGDAGGRAMSHLGLALLVAGSIGFAIPRDREGAPRFTPDPGSAATFLPLTAVIAGSAGLLLVLRTSALGDNRSDLAMTARVMTTALPLAAAAAGLVVSLRARTVTAWVASLVTLRTAWILLAASGAGESSAIPALAEAGVGAALTALALSLAPPADAPRAGRGARAIPFLLALVLLALVPLLAALISPRALLRVSMEGGRAMIVAVGLIAAVLPLAAIPNLLRNPVSADPGS